MPEGPSITPVVLLTSITILILLLVVVILFVLFFRNKNNILKVEKEKRKQEIFKSQIEIREEVLRQIFIELHDNVGQLLSVAKLSLNSINKSKSDEYKINSAQDMISESLSVIRHLSRVLNPQNIKRLGFAEMIKVEFNRLNSLKLIKATYNIDDSIIFNKKEHNVILVRIVQEFIKNTITHAKASKLNLHLEKNQNVIQLKINDDGIGFDKSKFKKSEINGLKIIENRAYLIGANVEINSVVGKGTQLILTYNTKENED